MADEEVARWLGRLAGGVPRVRLNARTTAELVTNTHCSARRALDAAGIDKAALAGRLGVDSQRGQSPFAIGRGEQFERRVKRDEFLELLRLLKRFGLETRTVEVLDFEDTAKFSPKDPDSSLEKRAAQTRAAIVDIATGKAPPGLVLDHAALAWNIGGVSVRLEADALAWWVGGMLRVVEIKSYPIEWGQIPADKVSAMAWQTAVYVAALQDLLTDEGLDPALVSTEIFLICPRNTGLTPEVVAHNVAPQLRLIRRYERRESTLAELIAEVGEVTFDVADQPTVDQPNLLADALDRLRPNYQPNCLSTCDLAAHCRSCAQRDAHPNVLGGDVVQLMVGITDMHRAAEIIASHDTGPGTGQHSLSEDEQDFAEIVRRTLDVEQLVIGIPAA